MTHTVHRLVGFYENARKSAFDLGQVILRSEANQSRMLQAARPELVRVLAVVPSEGRTRLVTMGWGDGALDHAPCLSDPERDLRRAIGGPVPVSVVDLELDPERWHGRFVTTIGSIVWQRGPLGPLALGRVWVDRSLELIGRRLSAPLPSGTRARLTGMLFADHEVRSAHKERHGERGGYGQGGIYVAQLTAVSVKLEPR